MSKKTETTLEKQRRLRLCRQKNSWTEIRNRGEADTRENNH